MEKIIYISASILGSIVAGLICGIFPLAVSMKRYKPKYGIISIIVCIFVSLIGGIEICVPVMLVLIAWILIKTKTISQTEMDQLLEEKIENIKR